MSGNEEKLKEELKDAKYWAEYNHNITAEKRVRSIELFGVKCFFCFDHTDISDKEKESYPFKYLVGKDGRHADGSPFVYSQEKLPDEATDLFSSESFYEEGYYLFEDQGDRKLKRTFGLSEHTSYGDRIWKIDNKTIGRLIEGYQE